MVGKGDDKKYQNLSLSREYFYFASIVSVIIVSSLVWLVWFSYGNLEAKKDREYALEADRIQEVLEDSFIYTSNFMKFLGKTIVASGKEDSESVASILRTKIDANKIRDDVFPWTLFEFINSQNYLITSAVDSIHPSLKIDSAKRSWITTARSQPWVLHLSEPDIGVVSGEYVIPGGYGITDKNEKFIGIITIGFTVSKLKKKIERSLHYETSKFMLLTDDLKLIASSGDKSGSRDEFVQNLKKSNFLKKDHGKLNSELTQGDVSYRYYKIIQPHKYIVLIGQNKQYLHEEFSQLVTPQVVKTLVIGISFLILLYFFRMKIVNPMKLLSERARLLSKGNLDVKMPVANSSESAYLIEALELVKIAFQRENLVREQLFEANKKIKLINADLEEKIIESQKALEFKAEFLNNMSHEIRTPIQGVTGLSDGLVEHWHSFSDSKKLEIAKHVASNGKRLLSLVGNLLDLSKFTAGKMLLTFQKSDFNTLVEDMITECKSLYLNDKKIKFKFTNNGSMFAIIDPERIAQVLRNLFFNAIKFCPDKSVISVNSSVSRGNRGVKELRFSISNEGVGIPEDEIKAIFDPFTQSTLTKTNAGGTGLGLAICREIISSHRGEIWAENNKEGGVTFNFVIPILQDKQNNGIKKIEKDDLKESNKRSTAKAANILIIDDEEACLLSMELFLHQSHYTLIKTSSGVAGLQYLQKYGAAIDLVLLDLIMSDMHGLDALAEIRKQPNLAHIKIILQSGIDDEKTMKKAHSIGIDGYIKKPYQKQAVIAEIESVLSKQKKK